MFDEYKNIKVINIKGKSKIVWDYIRVLPYFIYEHVDAVIYPKILFLLIMFFSSLKN